MSQGSPKNKGSKPMGIVRGRKDVNGPRKPKK